jgi:hypothetical protein
MVPTGMTSARPMTTARKTTDGQRHRPRWTTLRVRRREELA